MIRTILVPLTIAALVPSRGAAQTGCARTSPYADEFHADMKSLFFEADSIADRLRGGVIQKLGASDTSYVVREDSVCDRVLPVAVAQMRASNQIWASGQEGNYTATVFRFGPYFVVTLGEEPGAAVENRRSPTLVYRAADLVLLKSFY